MGFKSCGMVLCAVKDGKCEFVDPPAEVKKTVLFINLRKVCDFLRVLMFNYRLTLETGYQERALVTRL